MKGMTFTETKKEIAKELPALAKIQNKGSALQQLQ